jgi:phosphoglycerate dehydrogenase-like enzyme
MHARAPTPTLSSCLPAPGLSRSLCLRASAAAFASLGVSTDLDEVLAASDVVVNVLPSTPATRGLLTAAAFKRRLSVRGAPLSLFLNIGRGDVIEEGELLQALDADQSLEEAVLDVCVAGELVKMCV